MQGGETTGSGDPADATSSGAASSGADPEPTAPDLGATTEGGDATTDGSTTAADTGDCERAVPCTSPTEDGTCRHVLTMSDGLHLAIWSNLPLPTADEAACHPTITRAVLVQHGNSRDPWDYLAAVQDAAADAGATAETIIVAPWFPAPEDDVPDDWHTWEPGGSGWKSGDDSLTEPALSSFAAMDELVARVLALPSLQQLVVTGHSAGGQFVQRWAVASPTDPQVASRVVVANPSSYLYLDAWRWDGDGAPPGVGFALPSDTDCEEYDDYKYGLANVPAGHYVAEHAAEIPARYLAREVVLLLGDADVLPENGFDASCPANMQGPHRFARGLVFGEYLDARFGGHAHTVAIVPGEGHDHAAMYGSPEGRAVLFEW